jgi:hypothetical protein
VDELLKSYHPHVSNNTKGDKFLYRTSSPAKMIKDEKYPLLVFFTVLEGVVKTIKNNYSMPEVLRILKKIK